MFAEDEYPASGRGDNSEGGAEPHHGALYRDYKAAGRRSGNITTPINSLVRIRKWLAFGKLLWGFLLRESLYPNRNQYRSLCLIWNRFFGQLDDPQ
jgi:hypothetical protein